MTARFAVGSVSVDQIMLEPLSSALQTTVPSEVVVSAPPPASVEQVVKAENLIVPAEVTPVAPLITPVPEISTFSESRTTSQPSPT